jgi:hypothetical protein
MARMNASREAHFVIRNRAHEQTVSSGMKRAQFWRFKTTSFSSFFFFSFVLLAIAGCDLAPSPKPMSIPRKCKCCGCFFELDQRNIDRHFYCRASRYQRARRAHSQRLRRQSPRTTHSGLWPLANGRRLQPTSNSLEAGWNAQDPAVIGLCSMLTESHDLEEIQTFIRRLRERGNAILGSQAPVKYESITE